VFFAIKKVIPNIRFWKIIAIFADVFAKKNNEYERKTDNGADGPGVAVQRVQ
jgi:hypothetical protein